MILTSLCVCVVFLCAHFQILRVLIGVCITVETTNNQTKPDITLRTNTFYPLTDQMAAISMCHYRNHKYSVKLYFQIVKPNREQFRNAQHTNIRFEGRLSKLCSVKHGCGSINDRYVPAKQQQQPNSHMLLKSTTGEDNNEYGTKQNNRISTCSATHFHFRLFLDRLFWHHHFLGIFVYFFFTFSISSSSCFGFWLAASKCGRAQPTAVTLASPHYILNGLSCTRTWTPLQWHAKTAHWVVGHFNIAIRFNGLANAAANTVAHTHTSIHSQIHTSRKRKPLSQLLSRAKQISCFDALVQTPQNSWLSFQQGIKFNRNPAQWKSKQTSRDSSLLVLSATRALLYCCNW